jgi:hypothetical protein
VNSAVGKTAAADAAKTVSVHVSNILAEMGVASRGEAAVAADRLRVFDAVPLP